MKLLTAGLSAFVALGEAGSQYNWRSGAIEEVLAAQNATGPQARRFREVKGMLRSLICFDYFEANPTATSCPHKESSYFRALRDYGCNCYPEGDDTVSSFDSSITLWNMGNNGVPVDDVDAVCRNVWGKYHCYNYDGCKMGIDYTYHLSADGVITCGPSTDVDYASDPDSFMCELAACKIEKFLADELYPILGDPGTFRSDNSVNYNAWKSSVTCQKQPGMHVVKKECCGDYPKRVPFDADEFECCADGKIELTGFCGN